MIAVWMLVALLHGAPSHVVVDNIASNEECHVVMARMGLSNGSAVCIPVEKRFVP